MLQELAHQGGLHEPKPEDDLVMLVHCLHAQIFPASFSSIKYSLEGESTEGWGERIAAYWKEQMKPQVWKELEEAAAKRKYSKLKQLIGEIMP